MTASFPPAPETAKFAAVYGRRRSEVGRISSSEPRRSVRECMARPFAVRSVSSIVIVRALARDRRVGRRIAQHKAVRRGSNCPRLMPCPIFERLLVRSTRFDRLPHPLFASRDTL